MNEKKRIPKNEEVQINFKLSDNNGLFSVNRKGEVFQWKCDTLIIISYWDEKGEVVSQAVSSKNNWVFKTESIENGYALECKKRQSGLLFKIIFIIKNDVLTVGIPASAIKESGTSQLKSMHLLPDFGAAANGDDGYLAIAHEVGGLCYFNDKESNQYKLPVYNVNGINMPLFGMVRGASGFAGIITSGQFDSDFCIRTNWGKQHHYSISPEYILRTFKNENRLSDNLNVEYHFLASEEANWAGIGKRYREYNFRNRGIRTIKQRDFEAPGLADISQSMEVRLRLGVKPVPYEIIEQTPATEPAVRAFLTFKRVRDIFDEFYKQGIRSTEFCLVGWNIGGHDGRYPQIFPPDPTLGGEEELRKTIAYGQSLGFNVVAHDNYIDAYRIANCWDENYLARNMKGELVKGGKWGGGQAYHTCMVEMYDQFAKKNVPMLKELGFRGIHYSDVLSITRPLPCYAPNHPATRRESAEARIRIMELMDSLIGGVQSEGSLDFAAPVIDRFLYTSIHPKNSSHLNLPYLDIDVPLFATVYHGVMTYNLDALTVNSLPGETEYLKNIEYGGIPTAYFYGHFYMEGSNRKNWIGNRDYQFEKSDELTKIVNGISMVYKDLEIIKHLQLEFIEGHSQLAEGVFKTIYANGECIVVNYNEKIYELKSGKKVPERGFIVLKGCRKNK